jgi:hypothetical protein
MDVESRLFLKRQQGTAVFLPSCLKAVHYRLSCFRVNNCSLNLIEQLVV